MIMASGPITSWQIKTEKMEIVADFISVGSKTPVDSDCSHEIKRRLLLGRKTMTSPDSILKSRDITLPTKVYPVKDMVFPACSLKKNYDKPRQRIKKQRHLFADKGPYSQSYGFSSSHVQM